MGSPKKPKVGNRYFYGVHLIPARKADAVLAIRMADKVVWEGDQGDGFIDINDKEAFGGDEREGGFSGRIAVMLGKAAQTANTYLQGIFGAFTPAFYGVLSLVFWTLTVIVALKLLPIALGMGCVVAAILAGLAVLGVSLAALLICAALVVAAVLSPVWVPVLAIIGVIALFRRGGAAKMV